MLHRHTTAIAKAGDVDPRTRADVDGRTLSYLGAGSRQAEEA
jgi:hypothetical protein